MAGKIELNISESTLERLCCSLCRGYLSCPPIRILPDGSSICGRCSPPESYVQLNLQDIMRDATFPCKFSQNGCQMRLPFGYASTNDHEANCAHRTDRLPESPKPGSPKPEESPKPGCSTQKSEQVANDSSTFVLHNAELTLKLDRDEKSVPVVSPVNHSTVINPFNIRRASNASSVVSLRNLNRNFTPPPRPPSRANSWNGNFNNSYDRNGNSYYGRNWNNMPPYRPWPRWDYERHNYRSRSYHNRRKNNVVIIKGHTLYITL